MKNDIFKLSKLKKSKAGFNDMVIIAICAGILLFTSFLIPSINSAFSTTASGFDDENLKGTVSDGAESVTTISAFSVITSFLKLALWDPSNSLSLPIWMDLFFTLLFIVMVITIARNLWIGGGG